jgi:1-acyl-sn-glycerol-3-phosphate acyltransferase
VRRFIKGLATIFVGLLYRVKVQGLENIDNNRPYLLCANHTSIMDLLFIQVKLKRWVYWMAKKELFKNPLFGKFLEKLGAFPVERGKADLSALRKALKILNEGHICGVFPEGTRQNQHVGEELKPKSGAAFIAYKAGVNILPVYITPNHRPFSTVHIVIGKPFAIEREKNHENGNGAALKENARYIMDRIYALKENII